MIRQVAKPRPGPIRMRVLHAMVDRGWMATPEMPMCDLLRLSELGYATQCGRLFHPTQAAREISEMARQPPPQLEMFA